MTSGTRIAEIIETTTVHFTAETPRLHALPPLGSLVKVAANREPDAPEIYAIVSYGETAGIDTTRRAVRRGQDGTHDQDIYREHPELRLVLRTTFQAAIVGFADINSIHQSLPPVPPPLHFSVWTCTPAEVAAFTDQLLYLRVLATAVGPVAPEQVLAAHIREVFACREYDLAWLEAAGQEVARLYKADYDRLLTVLHAIDPGSRVNGRHG